MDSGVCVCLKIYIERYIYRKYIHIHRFCVCVCMCVCVYA